MYILKKLTAKQIVKRVIQTSITLALIGTFLLILEMIIFTSLRNFVLTPLAMIGIVTFTIGILGGILGLAFALIWIVEGFE